MSDPTFRCHGTALRRTESIDTDHPRDGAGRYRCRTIPLSPTAAIVVRSRRGGRDGRVRATAHSPGPPRCGRDIRQPSDSSSPARPQVYRATRVPGSSRPGDETVDRSGKSPLLRARALLMSVGRSVSVLANRHWPQSGHSFGRINASSALLTASRRLAAVHRPGVGHDAGQIVQAVDAARVASSVDDSRAWVSRHGAHLPCVCRPVERIRTE